MPSWAPKLRSQWSIAWPLMPPLALMARTYQAFLARDRCAKGRLMPETSNLVARYPRPPHAIASFTKPRWERHDRMVRHEVTCYE